MKQAIEDIKTYAWFRWTEWSEWSECSDQGIKTRSRECHGKNCLGEGGTKDTENCDAPTTLAPTTEAPTTKAPTTETPTAGTQFYLATNGSDSWDGTSPVHQEGTNVGPWATLSQAILKIRNLRPNLPGPEDLATLNIISG